MRMCRQQFTETYFNPVDPGKGGWNQNDTGGKSNKTAEEFSTPCSGECESPPTSGEPEEEISQLLGARGVARRH